MKKVLVVVDMQNDFVYGSLGSKEAQEVVPNVVAKVKEYVDNENYIVFTQDSHGENYMMTQEGKYLPVEHCIVNTNGWEIVPELQKYITSSVLKTSFGSITLADEIRNMDCEEIEFVGVCTDICVISNVLLMKTFFPEMPITVDAACCAGVTPDKHEAALEVMRSCQINVVNG